jgi:hypothetical protein
MLSGYAFLFLPIMCPQWIPYYLYCGSWRGAFVVSLYVAHITQLIVRRLIFCPSLPRSRLARGDNLFIYSREGHSRCSFICAALLGRLYSLNIHHTLNRIQACHDSQRSVCRIKLCCSFLDTSIVLFRLTQFQQQILALLLYLHLRALKVPLQQSLL